MGEAIRGAWAVVAHAACGRFSETSLKGQRMVEPHRDATGAGALLSVNVGLPQDVAWKGKTVHTGIYKVPVEGPRTIRRLNIDGDGQGDLAGHGGEMRAVLVYQRESYEFWRREFGRDDIEYGQFGENL